MSHSLTKSLHSLYLAILTFVNFAASVLILIAKQPVSLQPPQYIPNLITVTVYTTILPSLKYMVSNRSKTALLLNSLTPLLFSNLFTGLKLMNVFNIKFCISPSNFSIPRNLPTCITWFLSKLHVILDLHLLSLLLVHQLAPPKKLSVVLFATHHLTSGINFLTHFVSHVLICLFLIHLFFTIISPRQCHHHHSYHQSPHHSSIPNSKLSCFSNPTLHRHLAPLRTDFTDTRTASGLFSLFRFF